MNNIKIYNKYLRFDKIYLLSNALKHAFGHYHIYEAIYSKLLRL